MKIALVVPLDFTAVLCCKIWIEDLQLRSDDKLVVIGEYFPDKNNYQEELRSWGVVFEHVPMSRHINPLLDLKYMWSLWKIFRKYKFDYVLNTCTKPNIYGPLAARLAGTNKILISVWGRGSAYLENQNIKFKILRFLLNNLYSLSFSLASYVWFTNKNDVDYFSAIGSLKRDKVILTKNYIDVDKYRPRVLSSDVEMELRKNFAIGKNDKVVVSVSRMIWSKGIKEFAEASQVIEKERSDIKFILVGAVEKGSPDSVPYEFLEMHSKRENFQWIGYREDLLDIYALSDLAVLPSFYKEGGYPRALTEPMAMGKPVIAADTPDCRSPIENGKNGYLVPPRDSKSLAECILKIMSDDQLRHKFGKYSAKRAKLEYDEKIIIPEMDKVFFEKFLGEE